MDSLNKTISFVLGLVVVLVFLAVITGRLNLKKLPVLTKSSTPTPTSFVYPSPTPVATKTPINNYQKQQVNSAKKIPATGLPTFFLPALILALFLGLELRRAAKSRNS